MAARQPIYTIEEANALLPQVRAILLQLAIEQRRLEAAHAEMHRGLAANGDPAARAAAARGETEMTGAREGIRGLLGLLERDGVQLRDAEMGLVDFPARRDGQLVWLCWRLSDPSVAHWHGTDEGYVSRRLW